MDKNQLASVILVIIIIALGVLLANTISSSYEDGVVNERIENSTESLSRFENIKTIKYDGHEYLLYNSAVGSSITHKENCKYDL